MDQELFAVGQKLDTGELGFAILKRHHPHATIRECVGILTVWQTGPYVVVRELRVFSPGSSIHVDV